jgi:S1-C subfamily serine protease
MRSFLAYYHNPSRPGWGVDPPPSGERRRPMTFETHPGFGQWASAMGINAADMKCIFCHRTPGIVVTPELKKSYDRDKRVYDLGLPLAEQLGVEFDSADLAIVGRVEEGSPAAKAGVEVGDMLGGINGRRVFGVSDLRVWMGQVPMKGGELKLVLLRGGKAVETTVKLSDGWKKYDIGWRRSIAISTMGAHPGFAWSKALTSAEREQRGLPADALAITPQFPKDTSKSSAFNAGLRPQHVITAINGKSPDISGNAIIVWFRMNTMPGDDIELTILDGAAKKTIKYKAVVR